MLICNLCQQEFNTNKELIKHLIKDHKFELNQIYKYFNIDLTNENQICLICGKNFKLDKRQLKNLSKNINKIIGCSNSCRTSLLLFLKNPAKNKEVVEKRKQTNLEKYGGNAPMCSISIKEKTKQTNLEKYGGNAPMCSNSIKEKIKQTNLEKYGVEHTFQVAEFREKAKQTNLEKYGAKYIGASKEIQEKIKQTNLERYGVENPLESKEIQEKIKQTNLKRYGGNAPIASKEVQEKIKQTNLERYGVENVWNKESTIRQRLEKTNLEKYGAKNVWNKNSIIRNKIKQTNLEKYGVEYFCQHKKCIEVNGHRISKINRDFYNLLLKNNINAELEYIIETHGYDLKVDNILIELNPWYTHNSTFGAKFAKGFTIEPKKFDYHYNKTKLANENGFICIHVFDWMDWETIIENIKNNLYKNQQVDINNIKKHWYNPKTKQHIIDTGMQSEIIMIHQNYVEICDDGSNIDILK